MSCPSVWSGSDSAAENSQVSAMVICEEFPP